MSFNEVIVLPIDVFRLNIRIKRKDENGSFIACYCDTDIAVFGFNRRYVAQQKRHLCGGYDQGFYL